MKGALGMEHLSLRELCEGNLEGRGASLLVTPKDMVSTVLEMDFSTGAPLLGNMEKRFFPRVFERRDTFLYLWEFL
jgi:hypothetical protein